MAATWSGLLHLGGLLLGGEEVEPLLEGDAVARVLVVGREPSGVSGERSLSVGSDFLVQENERCEWW